jgi:biopolymer transport protein TolR
VQPLEVTLRPDRTLLLRDQEACGPASVVSREQLVERIRAKRARLPGQPVVIAADKGSRYEDVLAILDLLRRNGTGKVGLLARPAGA